MGTVKLFAVVSVAVSYVVAAWVVQFLGPSLGKIYGKRYGRRAEAMLVYTLWPSYVPLGMFWAAWLVQALVDRPLLTNDWGVIVLTGLLLPFLPVMLISKRAAQSIQEVIQAEHPERSEPAPARWKGWLSRLIR